MELLPDLGPQERVDPGRRLVEEEQRRVVHERAGELETSLHAAGELAGTAPRTSHRSTSSRTSRVRRRRRENSIPNSDPTKSTFSRTVRSG